MSIFSNTGYMNFDKNLIHSAITPFHNDSDAEKIRKIDEQLTKCCPDKGFFVIALMLYNIDDIIVNMYNICIVVIVSFNGTILVPINS